MWRRLSGGQLLLVTSAPDHGQLMLVTSIKGNHQQTQQDPPIGWSNSIQGLCGKTPKYVIHRLTPNPVIFRLGHFLSTSLQWTRSLYESLNYSLDYLEDTHTVTHSISQLPTWLLNYSTTHLTLRNGAALAFSLLPQSSHEAKSRDNDFIPLGAVYADRPTLISSGAMKIGYYAADTWLQRRPLDWSEVKRAPCAVDCVKVQWLVSSVDLRLVSKSRLVFMPSVDWRRVHEQAS